MCSSIATTNSTSSRESNPSSSKETFQASFEVLHFAAALRTSNTLPSIISRSGLVANYQID